MILGLQKWQFILIVVLIGIIVLMGVVFSFIVFGQRNYILKLKLDNQNIQNSSIEKIEKFEIENERIKKQHSDLILELQKAVSLKDYIEITKKVNEELRKVSE